MSIHSSQLRLLIIATVLYCLPVGVVRAQSETKLLASDAAAGDNFGKSVAISGNRIIVGATDDQEAGIGTGAAYIFELDQGVWIEEAKLLASDAASGDNFGISVGIDGSVAVVGAWQDQQDNFGFGSAYVFRFNGTEWVEEAKLSPPSRFFGYSVSISDNRIIVGAYGEGTDVGEPTGAAYVFQYDGMEWTTEQRLTASDATGNERFGISVAIDDSVAAVGAHFDDDQGSAYVYRRDGSTWTEEQKIVASDAYEDADFGRAVSISGNSMVVGSANPSLVSTGGPGAAYFYTYDGLEWTGEQKVLPSHATNFSTIDQFGFWVSLKDDRAVVTSPSHETPIDFDAGYTYVYTSSGSMWIESDSTYASDGYHMQEYGVGGDIDGDLVVIGASEDGIGTGVAYVYDLLTPMPVELASFAAYVKKSNVYLSWTTSSESNNIGFDIQQERAGSWESVGFVPGNGTLTVTSNYSFLIEDLQDGTHSFRLGQIDVDGNYKFSDLVSAVVSTSTDFKLRDVYPNPFGTTVELSLWVNRSQDVSLTVFAADGRRVALLNNGFLDVGKHDYTLDAGNLSSGLYLVRVVGEKTVRTQLIIRL